MFVFDFFFFTYFLELSEIRKYFSSKKYLKQKKYKLR